MVPGTSGVASYGTLGNVPLDFRQFRFSSLGSKSDSHIFKYCGDSETVGSAGADVNYS